MLTFCSWFLTRIGDFLTFSADQNEEIYTIFTQTWFAGLGVFQGLILPLGYHNDFSLIGTV